MGSEQVEYEAEKARKPINFGEENNRKCFGDRRFRGINRQRERNVRNEDKKKRTRE